MPSRERWIVYPILFLALGLAMRPSVVSSVEVQEVRCRKLTGGVITGTNITGASIAGRNIAVVDADGRLQAELAATDLGGFIEFVRYHERFKNEQRPLFMSDGTRFPQQVGFLHRRHREKKSPAAAPEGDQAAQNEQPAKND